METDTKQLQSINFLNLYAGNYISDSSKPKPEDTISKPQNLGPVGPRTDWIIPDKSSVISKGILSSRGFKRTIPEYKADIAEKSGEQLDGKKDALKDAESLYEQDLPRVEELHSDMLCASLEADVSEIETLPAAARIFPEAPATEKNQDIISLEKFLSGAYADPQLCITRIENLPKSRKEVKRVYFTMGDDLCQVWVYKADPRETARELGIYNIVYKQGIPTARPIGYKLNQDKGYANDIAILGGIVEHAGEPYDKTIENLALSPIGISKTTGYIAELIAKMHYRLSLAKDEFDKAGIKLQRASPKKELIERMVAGLSINHNEKEVRELISACENLYSRQTGELVVSHGDIHPGNIVSLRNRDPSCGGRNPVSLKNFGLIDLGFMCLDYASGDLVDFWLHKFRKTLEVSGRYCFDLDDFICQYENSIKSMADTGNGFSVSKANTEIQFLLWNMYEMFDPTRKDAQDIERKAKFHYQTFLRFCQTMPKYDEIGCIKKNLEKILNKNYANVMEN